MKIRIEIGLPIKSNLKRFFPTSNLDRLKSNLNRFFPNSHWQSFFFSTSADRLFPTLDRQRFFANLRAAFFFSPSVFFANLSFFFLTFTVLFPTSAFFFPTLGSRACGMIAGGGAVITANCHHYFAAARQRLQMPQLPSITCSAGVLREEAGL